MATPFIDDIFRAASSAKVAIDLLGLLHNLPGHWTGKGFNMIARPARQGVSTNPTFFLELNGTSETLEFFTIGGDIPNRGEIEPNALLHGMHYLQTIADCEDNSFIHKEPGLWLHVPKTAESPSTDTYVRHATIPHGNSLAAQSTFFGTFPTGPDIKPVNSFPFPQTDPIPDLNDITHATIPSTSKYLEPYLTFPLPPDCMPKGLDPAKTIKDPTEVLRAQIAGQAIVETVVIQISTAPLQGGGIVNIPFLTKNANVAQMDAIFWIEKVTNPTKKPTDPNVEYMQLQYVQRVILDFDNIHWPHFSVATLAKAA
jgi:hypothetical protein